MEIKGIRSDKAPKPIGPYSQAVRAGNTLYVSGIIPLDMKSGTLVRDNIKAACDTITGHLENILREAGYSKNNVVKTTIYLKNMDDFTDVNSAYSDFFGDVKTYPARSTIEVSGLPKDAPLEMDFIAVKD
ncbi:MAG: deaminase [Oligoflexia bacterium]|nr:deaminase [Oligoflexia bacterium]